MSHTGVERPAESAHPLLLPFIACASEGGPYPDDAFNAGVECGKILAELGHCEAIGATPRPRWLIAGIVPQVDLIAMRFGYTVTTEESDERGRYVRIAFARPHDAG